MLSDHQRSGKTLFIFKSHQFW